MTFGVIAHLGLARIHPTATGQANYLGYTANESSLSLPTSRLDTAIPSSPFDTDTLRLSSSPLHINLISHRALVDARGVTHKQPLHLTPRRTACPASEGLNCHLRSTTPPAATLRKSSSSLITYLHTQTILNCIWCLNVSRGYPSW